MMDICALEEVHKRLVENSTLLVRKLTIMQELMMPELATSPFQPLGMETKINPDYVDALQQFEGRNELGLLGFTPAGMALNALRLARKPAVILAAGAGLLFGVTQGAEVKVTADMNAAETSVDASLIHLDTTTRIEAVRASFSEEMSAQKIPFIIDRPAPIGGFDTIKDCERNKFLKGVGTVEYKVPLTAISSVPGADGKTNFVVDGSKLETSTYWPGAGPEIKNYEVTGDGKRDYGDQGDACLQWMDANIANGDQEMGNMKKKLDDQIEHDMRLMGLKVMQQNCSPKLNDFNQQSIKKSITEVVTLMGKKDQMGEVTFTKDPIKWNEIKIPKAKLDKVGDTSADYQLDPKGFKVDKINCNVDIAKAQAGATS
jgi:hypothetical protein